MTITRNRIEATIQAVIRDHFCDRDTPTGGWFLPSEVQRAAAELHGCPQVSYQEVDTVLQEMLGGNLLEHRIRRGYRVVELSPFNQEY